ncbi:IS4 family transposase [Heliobacterium mobile]|nr:IS4 family transposase [Heliobacterium mobile]
MKKPSMKTTVLEEELTRLFPSEWLRETAKETGFVKRFREIDPVVFFWALVLSFGVGLSRNLANVRRLYGSMSGADVVPSSFYDRFKPELIEFLKRCISRATAMEASESVPELSEKLQGFVELLCIDSTLVRLHDSLAKDWPGPRTNHSPAALKLNMVISVVGAGPREVQMVEGKKGESPLLKIGPWVESRILLFDLGYFKFKHFQDIDRHNGFFVSRLKDNANPLILHTLKQHRGNAIDVGYQKLRDIEPRLKRDVLDVEVQITTSTAKSEAVLRKNSQVMRVVGIWNEELKKYHFYITNLSVETLSAEEVAQLYRARWAIELTFKELKSNYQLDTIDSANKSVVQALICTAILTMIVSRRLLNLLKRMNPQKAKQMTNLRWANVFTVGAPQLFEAVMIYMGLNPRGYNPLFDMFIAESIDPNVSRKRMLDPWVK